MSEKTVQDSNLTYPIDPTDFTKIQQHLKDHPARFTDTRGFITKAIEILHLWETNPKMAEEKMNERPPLIPQLVKMKMMMKEEAIEKMYPGELKRNEKEIQQFEEQHPEWFIKKQTSQETETAKEAQDRERKSRDDYEKLKLSLNESTEFIRSIDFKKIKPQDNQREIGYDGWPLLWSYYSRILPAKISIAAIVDIMYRTKSNIIKLDTKNLAHIYDIAEELCEKLEKYEKEHKSKRHKKISTGLPNPFTKENPSKKEIKIQYETEDRYKDRFIGKIRKSKDTGTMKFDGLLSALGLVRAFYNEEKEIFLTLTENGKNFYLHNNPILHNDDFTKAFSEEERQLIVTKIFPQRDLEMILVKTAMEVIDTYDDKMVRKITDSLDDQFYNVVKEFVNADLVKPFLSKIHTDIIIKTDKIKENNENEPEKKPQQTPIQAYRTAIMGRLSEIGLIRWDIKADSKGRAESNYYTSDQEMAKELLK